MIKIIISLAIGETRNEMDPSNDQVWIDESECISRTLFFKKLETVQLFRISSSSIVRVQLKPGGEKYIHPNRFLET